MRMLHTMIRVRDLEKSLAFYTGFVGLRETHRKRIGDEATLVFLSDGESPHLLELTYNHDGPEYTLGDQYGHLAFGVPDARLHAAGVVTVATGVGLLAGELAKTGIFLYTGAGAASILKLALLGLGLAFPVARFELYLAATLVASVGSHMSGRWRHWSLADRRTLTQD